MTVDDRAQQTLREVAEASLCALSNSPHLSDDFAPHIPFVGEHSGMMVVHGEDILALLDWIDELEGAEDD